jgi:hypothetical protein
VITFAAKDSTNPFFKSRYADLASVIGSSREALANNGLSIIQSPGFFVNGTPGYIELYTLLSHESGQWVKSLMQIPVKTPAPAQDVGASITYATAQDVGASITYARRYAWAATIGIYQDDDDGNTASQKVVESRNDAVIEYKSRIENFSLQDFSTKCPALMSLIKSTLPNSEYLELRAYGLKKMALLKEVN